MARFRRKRAKKAKEKMTGESPNASLAAMAPIISAKGIFSAIHQQVVVPQKSIEVSRLATIRHNIGHIGANCYIDSEGHPNSFAGIINERHYY